MSTLPKLIVYVVIIMLIAVAMLVVLLTKGQFFILLGVLIFVLKVLTVCTLTMVILRIHDTALMEVLKQNM